MNKNIKYLILTMIVCSLSKIKSQNIGVGASAIYNFQSEGFGVGTRASIYPNKRLSIVPQFSYFFGFNKVSEYTIGLGLEAKFIKLNKFNMYGLVHGGYNRWLNYKSSPMKDAKPNNWNLEGGLGISTNTCLRPFLEYRYNIKFRETHLNLGFLYIFGCKKGNHFREVECPTF